MDAETKKIRVAVIDDDAGLVATIQSFLESRGFTVSCAYGGTSGIELVRQEKPDVVILDITMPDKDGRDVLIELKKNPDTKNIPVIVLTGKGEQFERDYGIDIGADDYIAKPYDSYMLLRAVNHAAQKPPSAP